MKYNELLRILNKHGWYEIRQSGSHKIMGHKDNQETISVPAHGSQEVKKGYLKAILKKTGIKTKKR